MTNNNQTENSVFLQSLSQESLQVIEAMKQDGNHLAEPGRGYYVTVTLNCIYGYSALASDANKQIMAQVIQSAAENSNFVAVLGYNILADSVILVLKGHDERLTRSFVGAVVQNFTECYNKSQMSVGVPFRSNGAFRAFPAKNLEHEISSMYAYSPCEPSAYPYNSVSYMASGSTLGNLVLGLDLDIVTNGQYGEMYEGLDLKERSSGGKEPLKWVMSRLGKRLHKGRKNYTEKELDFYLSETAARSGVPYGELTHKMQLDNRPDLRVSAVCDFMDRRRCGFTEAVKMLGLEQVDQTNLAIEVLAEINRTKHYGYWYIAENILKVDDRKYFLLVKLFRGLKDRYGYTFEQLCIRFHIIDNILEIRQACGF